MLQVRSYDETVATEIRHGSRNAVNPVVMTTTVRQRTHFWTVIGLEPRLLITLQLAAQSARQRTHQF